MPFNLSLDSVWRKKRAGAQAEQPLTLSSRSHQRCVLHGYCCKIPGVGSGCSLGCTGL